MVTKPLRGDPWVNGAFDDGKDFQGPSNFFNGFPTFPKHSASVPSPSTDNGTSKLIDLLVKISSYREFIDIFCSSKRGLIIYGTNAV